MLAGSTAYALSVDEDDAGRQGMSYAKALFLNDCTSDYYYYFNPSDQLSAKYHRQMMNHITTSCQCVYNKLSQAYSDMDILSYVQSRYANTQRMARRAFGNTPREIENMLESRSLRNDCQYKNHRKGAGGN